MTDQLKGKSVWGNQAFGGYAGLKFTSDEINDYIPKSKIYVEPFAGMERTVRMNKHETVILNDMSEFAVLYLICNFPNAIVTKEQFDVCIIKHDSKATFFLIDPPYSDNVYKLNDKCFIDRYYRDYYKRLSEILPIIQGDWILCINERNYRRFVKDLFPNNPTINIKSKKRALFGLHSNIQLISNKPLIRLESIPLEVFSP